MDKHGEIQGVHSLVNRPLKLACLRPRPTVPLAAAACVEGVYEVKVVVLGVTGAGAGAVTVAGATAVCTTGRAAWVVCGCCWGI